MRVESSVHNSETLLFLLIRAIRTNDECPLPRTHIISEQQQQQQQGEQQQHQGKNEIVGCSAKAIDQKNESLKKLNTKCEHRRSA
jgi:hypothetical protein